VRVVTNIGAAHTAGVGGIEGVVRAKGCVFPQPSKGAVLASFAEAIIFKTRIALTPIVMSMVGERQLDNTPSRLGKRLPRSLEERSVTG
jgi:UDP-N-acetylmuramyl pentapeptide synthase